MGRQYTKEDRESIKKCSGELKELANNLQIDVYALLRYLDVMELDKAIQKCKEDAYKKTDEYKEILFDYVEKGCRKHNISAKIENASVKKLQSLACRITEYERIDRMHLKRVKAINSILAKIEEQDVVLEGTFLKNEKYETTPAESADMYRAIVIYTDYKKGTNVSKYKTMAEQHKGYRGRLGLEIEELFKSTPLDNKKYKSSIEDAKTSTGKEILLYNRLIHNLDDIALENKKKAESHRLKRCKDRANYRLSTMLLVMPLKLELEVKDKYSKEYSEYHNNDNPYPLLSILDNIEKERREERRKEIQEEKMKAKTKREEYYEGIARLRDVKVREFIEKLTYEYNTKKNMNIDCDEMYRIVNNIMGIKDIGKILLEYKIRENRSYLWNLGKIVYEYVGVRPSRTYEESALRCIKKAMG